MNQKTPDEWGAEYSRIRGTHESYAIRLRGLVEDLLEAAHIDYVQVEARAKTVESFVEKIRRKGRLADDPFRSVTDLVGIRVITYYVEDVETVGALIRREFALDVENTVDKSAALGADQFGYKSAHFVASLGNGRETLAEWALFKDISVEFQVRTALQHAWAAVSHKLDYKSPEDAPESLRRRLFRLSALFELADEQFSTLRDESVRTEGVYRAQVRAGTLDIPVDASSVGAYLSLSGARERLGGMFSRYDETRLGKIGGPVSDERLKRDLSDLVKTLKLYDMNSLEDLDAYLADTSHIEHVLKAMEQQYSDEDMDDAEEYLSVEDLLTQIIIVDQDKSDVPGQPTYTEETSAGMKRARNALSRSVARK